MCIDSSQHDEKDMMLRGNYWEDWHAFSNIFYSFRVNPEYCMGYDGSLESVPEEYSYCKLSRTHSEMFKNVEISAEANHNIA